MNSTRATISTDEILAGAATASGLELAGAELIRDGSHAIYRLAGGIVARIGAPSSLEAAIREVRIAQWLNDSGIPAVEPMAFLPQTVVVHDRPVTWWHRIPDHRPATPEELGSMLRNLHALSPPPELELPTYDPFTGLCNRLALSSTLDEDDREWLLHHHNELRTRYDTLPKPDPLTVIHGDAWQGNLVVPSSGVPRVLDLDKVSLGLREWDLIQLAVDYTDFNRIFEDDYRSFVSAYGGYDVTSWPHFRLLADIQELRWLGFAVARAEDSRAAAQHAKHRIECLRGQVPRPWTWTAL
ncbi:aminoglycoside phosphotransferase family protein [Nocardia sp. NBC_00508]|uniref:phosphotransferase enzyme family protein n=1 Tax=Nocardia sp. NBC_00508 TaxID=2975992 RepID=UPI002E809040|nr:aminoglycoside phosphotransferase family protein [Nocardia sp. NBC_00508]WUD63717.1 aminoglycoside phosphotransferase family protein [Nocardia sp. NBC_00508]